MITIQEMVQREVIYNISYLIDELLEYYEELLEVHEKYKKGEDEPYKEALEHFLVSDWLFNKLKEKGEMVMQFKELNIWGRTVFGQSISQDKVIKQIYQELINS